MNLICFDRNGSVYVDMEFKYDSFLIFIIDVMDVVWNVMKMGLIYLFLVDDYFMFRGGIENILFFFLFCKRLVIVCNMKVVIFIILFIELKDGMCFVFERNFSVICLEECYVDFNCMGVKKCCFNGCGYMC